MNTRIFIFIFLKQVSYTKSWRHYEEVFSCQQARVEWSPVQVHFYKYVNIFLNGMHTYLFLSVTSNFDSMIYSSKQFHKSQIQSVVHIAQGNKNYPIV